MVEMLRRFVEEKGLGNPTFKDIEREVIRQGIEGKKQKKIEDYFEKWELYTRKWSSFLKDPLFSDFSALICALKGH